MLVSSNGYVKLTDWGLARLLHLKGKEGSLTHNLGTPEYTAPELYQGEKASKEIDWWALGIMM